jgi:hypothetical protein
MFKEILATSSVCEVRFNFVEESLSHAFRELEAESLNFEVQLERSRRKHLEEEKKYIDKILQILSLYGQPIRFSVVVLICNKARTEEILSKLALYGCKPRKKCIKINFRKQRPRLIGVLYRRGFIVPRPLLTNVLYNLFDYYASLLLAYVGQKAVPLGYTLRSRHIVFLPLFDEAENAYHSVIVGPTGRGKTTLLAHIALTAEKLGIAKCSYIVDPKGDLKEYVKKYGLRNYVILDADYNDYNTLAYLPAQCRRKKSILVIDEAWRVDQNLLVAVYKLARSKKIAIIAATQDPWDISASVWNNSSNIVIFGSTSPDYSNKLSRVVDIVEEDKELITSLIGVGDFAIKYRWSRRLIEAHLPVELVAKL